VVKASTILSGFSLGVAIGACGLAGALSLRAGVEPLYAVIRGIAAFGAVLCAARWSAGVLDSLAAATSDHDEALPGLDAREGLSGDERRANTKL